VKYFISNEMQALMIHKQSITQYIRIDPEMRAITCLSSNVTVNMRPLPFRVLIYLLKHQDRCISRDELFEVCWQGAIVSEQSLTNTISYIRKTIKKLESNELKLNTISKKGYSLVITLSNKLPEDNHDDNIVDTTEELDKIITLADGSSDCDKTAHSTSLMVDEKIDLSVTKRSYINYIWSFVSIILTLTLIFLIAKDNKGSAPFMDEKNYQLYKLDNVDVYMSDVDGLLVEDEFNKHLDNSSLNSCDIDKVYIRVYADPYDKENVAMSAFSITPSNESLNIINYKLVDNKPYTSILESIQDDEFCHGSSISN
jgi:DNA-binding winged helix-turn-helix (wHTH) protein